MDDSNVIQCPNCDEEAIKNDTEILLGECYDCDYMFCTNCSQDFHGNSECEFIPTCPTIQDIEEDFNFLDLQDFDKIPDDCKIGQFKCQICLDFKANENAADLGCEHLNCLPCIKEYFESLINQSTVHNFKCPSDPNCKAAITPNVIQEIVDHEVFIKYNNILLDEYLKDIPEIVNCPKPNCGKRFPSKPEYGYCESCNYLFCTDCMKAYHGLTPCGQSEEEQVALIKQHLAADEAERERLELVEREKRRKEIQENDRFVKQYAKKCPNCRADIEKISGCHHMTCKCNTHFCWLCLQVIDSVTPYKHFGTNCALFDVPKE